MNNKTFRGHLQQDAQEFLRSFLNQIHEELEFRIPTFQSSSTSTSSSSLQASSDPNQLTSATKTVEPSGEGEVSDDSSGSQTHLVAKCEHDSPCVGKQSLSPEVVCIDIDAVYSVRPTTLALQKDGESSTHRENKQDLPSPEQIEVQFVGVDEKMVEEKQERLSSDSRTSLGENWDLQSTSHVVSSSIPSTPKTKHKHAQSSKKNHAHSDTPPLAHTSLQDSGRSSSRLSLMIPSLKVSDKGGKKNIQPSPPPRKPKSTSATRSIVTDVFEGKIESSVKCLKCQQVSHKVDAFQDLSLPIPGRSEMMKASKQEEREEPGSPSRAQVICNFFTRARDWTRDLILGPPTTLLDCMNVFFDTCDLQNDNKYFCENCKGFQNGQKMMKISKLPEVLCVHLKRFRFDTFHPSKIGRHISYPLEGLDLGPYLKEEVLEGDSVLYELSSIITHIGDAHFGHYVAYARHPDTKNWYKYDDSDVSEVSSDEVSSKQGYLLFYKKTVSVSEQRDRATLLKEMSLNMSCDNSQDDPLLCVSKHWLSLLRYTSHPGPIFQYDYVCQHGGVLSTISRRDYRFVTEYVPLSAWEKLTERFGGGPVVTDLQECEACNELHSILEERRKEEMAKIKQLQSRSGKAMFYISEKWVCQWRKFVHGHTTYDLPAGPIDNSCLVNIQEDRLFLTKNSGSYVKVSEKCWSYLQQRYGGGPTIVDSAHMAEV